jgi:transposase
MKQILSFSKATLKRLETEQDKAYADGNIHRYRVIQALLWIGNKECDFSFKEMADYLNVTAKTLYNWFKGFVTGGFDWLLRQWFKGRGAESKLNNQQKDELYEMIEAGPEKNGFDSGIWNSAMIMELILVRFGVKYNPRYLSKLLKNMGLSYQKAKFISDKMDEEEYQKARGKWIEETWPQILEEAKRNNSIILFGDEVSFAMWGSLARTWAPRGKQPVVKTKGCRKGLKMFGAIEFKSGQLHFMESLAYSLTPKSLKQLKEEGIPEELLTPLKELKNEKYKTKEEYLQALTEVLGEQEANKNQSVLLKHAETAGRFNGATYVEFLKQIIETSSSPIILIEDGAPYHRSQVVKEFVESHSEQISIERLPAFSPDFNPIEKLWKNTKKEATHCKYFETFEELRESVVKAFGKFLNDATKVIGVMKKLRSEAEAVNLL